jgi:SAM-dependent methyltransferase
MAPRTKTAPRDDAPPAEAAPEPRGMPAGTDAENLDLIEALAETVAPDDPALADWCRTYARNAAPRLAFDLELVERSLPRGAHVLEVGSVPPLLTAALQHRGYRVEGVDIAPERFRTAIAGLGLALHRCNVETERLPATDACFDGVLFHEIFEHLRINPIFTMREVLRVLRPGGLLFLSTPNLRSLRGLYNFVIHRRAHTCEGSVYRQYEKLETLGHMGHVREYTPVEVREFLEETGFEISSVHFRGRYGNPAARIAARLVPSWRPLVTFVAFRP